MTIVAGILSRRVGQVIPDAMCKSVVRVVSRHEKDDVQQFRAEQILLAKLDIGAYGVPAYHRSNQGSVAMLTGEPLFSDEPNGRNLDLELLHQNCLLDRSDILSRARGVYSAVVYEGLRNRLTLVVDKLGIRPMYLWLSKDYAIFGSALRILEELDFIPKTLDLQGISEFAGLGSPLGDRTPYCDVLLMNPGELIQIDTHSVNRRLYWRFDTINPSGDCVEVLSRKTFNTFLSAVNRRIGSDTSTVAFLSGGLDSRCVVAALARQDVRTHTFNFAIENTQDHIFGNQFAKQLRTIHSSVPRIPGKIGLDFSSLMSKAWSSSPFKMDWPPEHPQLVWSGEGGSVGLGHVHLSQPIVNLDRADQSDDAIQLFLEQEGFRLPVRLFRRSLQSVASRLLHVGILEQLKKIEPGDLGRRLYLFLMFNDQRRKLYKHFEDIDCHRLELQLPFFDSDFLASILEVPIDLCLNHRFYTQFFSLFGASVATVPWQTYRDHDPCPVQLPQEISYQWGAEHLSFEQKLRRGAFMDQARLMLAAKDFPNALLRKKSLRVAAWANYLGIRNYEYVIHAAHLYHTYWQRCKGTQR